MDDSFKESVIKLREAIKGIEKHKSDFRDALFSIDAISLLPEDRVNILWLFEFIVKLEKILFVYMGFVEQLEALNKD